MNRLAAETSPYLLQHADNPVDEGHGARLLHDAGRGARARDHRPSDRASLRSPEPAEPRPTQRALQSAGRRQAVVRSARVAAARERLAGGRRREGRQGRSAHRGREAGGDDEVPPAERKGGRRAGASARRPARPLLPGADTRPAARLRAAGHARRSTVLIQRQQGPGWATVAQTTVVAEGNFLARL